MKKVTLKDVARATGLTANTVSKVLNKKPYYSQDVEKRVMTAIGELGYVQDSIASSLRRGTSRTVAIVFDDLINPYYSFMTLSIAQKLAQAHYDVMIFSNFGENSFLDSELLAKINSRKADAVISFLEPVPAVAETLKKQNTPFLLVGRKYDDDALVSLYYDDFEGGKAAANHLIEKGYREIAYVGAHPQISADAMRFGGYRAALEEHGVPFRESDVFYFSDYKSIEPLAQDLVRRSTAKAVFCFNDIFSFGIIKELHKEGLSFPKDYALVGYDNIAKYLSLPYALTTVGMDSETMAETAVQITLKWLRGEDFTDLIRNPYSVELIPGSTT